MTTTLPPTSHAETPAHVTARIFITADPDNPPTAYVGRHRRPSWIARVPKAAVVAVSAVLYIAACVGGIQLFSTAR